MVADALTCPASLSAASVEVLDQALRLDAARRDHRQRALEALAALLYARPDLLRDSLVDRLADIARADPISQGVNEALVKVLRFLASTPAAPRVWTVLTGLLRDERLSPETRERLVPLLEDFVQWAPDLVALDDLLAVADSLRLARHRVFLLDYGIERLVFRAPETFTTERLERLATLFEGMPRYRYVLYSLVTRQRLAAEVRTALSHRLAGLFPWHGPAADILKAGPVRVLVIFNLRLGQGDEIVRAAALLQAVLDANPALTIALIVQRAYLYDHPRVRTVAIGDEAAVRLLLTESFDGLIEFSQPDQVELTHRDTLHKAVERVLAERRPPFVVRAELGRAGPGDIVIPAHFVYNTVELDGCDIAEPLGLHRRALRSNYEACLRLLAELGLPQRAGEEACRGPSLLAGVRSADAERLWQGLVGEAPTDRSSPVALLNPFGGASPTKGFREADEPLLAAEITGLVEEGYRVVLIPNGTPWGGRAAADAALSRLDPKTRAHVRVAPDPAELGDTVRLELDERSEIAYPDRVMRLFKYFAAYADLVVTVEGWLAHMAYHLGRPFRLFLAAGSYTFEWCPHGLSRGQRLVTRLSACSRAAHAESGLLREGDPPPAPHQPRKFLLELALAGLGRQGDAAVALLERARASPDANVRIWAVWALGQTKPEVTGRAALLVALEDPWPAAAREAANVLLRWDVDCSRELGPGFREALRAHAAVMRSDWDSVRKAGPVALPALFRAARGTSYVVSREAKRLLREMLVPYVPQLHQKSGAGEQPA